MATKIDPEPFEQWFARCDDIGLTTILFAWDGKVSSHHQVESDPPKRVVVVDVGHLGHPLPQVRDYQERLYRGREVVTNGWLVWWPNQPEVVGGLVEIDPGGGWIWHAVPLRDYGVTGPEEALVYRRSAWERLMGAPVV